MRAKGRVLTPGTTRRSAPHRPGIPPRCTVYVHRRSTCSTSLTSAVRACESCPVGAYPLRRRRHIALFELVRMGGPYAHLCAVGSIIIIYERRGCGIVNGRYGAKLSWHCERGRVVSNGWGGGEKEGGRDVCRGVAGGGDERHTWTRLCSSLTPVGCG